MRPIAERHHTRFRPPIQINIRLEFSINFAFVGVSVGSKSMSMNAAEPEWRDGLCLVLLTPVFTRFVMWWIQMCDASQNLAFEEIAREEDNRNGGWLPRGGAAGGVALKYKYRNWNGCRSNIPFRNDASHNINCRLSSQAGGLVQIPRDEGNRRLNYSLCDAGPLGVILVWLQTIIWEIIPVPSLWRRFLYIIY